MAWGTHWEWRGFGDLSAAFAERYADLELSFESQELDDIYLWAPDLQGNIKVRLGEEEGLKFKWLRERRLPFELWEERPEDFFKFPLSQTGWERLVGAGIKVGGYPRTPPGLPVLLDALGETDCELVKVTKQREGRAWQGASGRVLVGWTRIDSPRSVETVGLEIDVSDDDDRQALLDLRQAIAALGLDSEDLRVMNYLQALQEWAGSASVK